MAESKTPTAKTDKAIRPGDTVHAVIHTHNPGSRFRKEHVEAEVLKVHEKGKFVDLIIHNEDPTKSVTITRSPRDDGGETADTWHFPEEAPPVDPAAVEKK